MAKHRKKAGCISTTIIFPFYVVYYVFYIGVSFLVGIFNFMREIIKLIFASSNSMTGSDYEYKVADYLRRNGFWGVKVTQASGDYGIDITAHKGCKKYAIQCKYYSKPVGISAVQEVYAGKIHYGCSEAIVITNNTFTSSAKTLAEENGVKLIEGIN